MVDVKVEDLLLEAGMITFLLTIAVILTVLAAVPTRPVGRCESCRRDTGRTWTDIDGEVFAVCEGCRPHDVIRGEVLR